MTLDIFKRQRAAFKVAFFVLQQHCSKKGRSLKINLLQCYSKLHWLTTILYSLFLQQAFPFDLISEMLVSGLAEKMRVFSLSFEKKIRIFRYS